MENLQAIPYPLHWIDVNFSVKELIIIIILQIPLLDQTVDVWSIAYEACNTQTQWRAQNSMTKMHVNLVPPNSRQSRKVMRSNTYVCVL